jgi:hypothetical protein
MDHFIAFYEAGAESFILLTLLNLNFNIIFIKSYHFILLPSKIFWGQQKVRIGLGFMAKTF